MGHYYVAKHPMDVEKEFNGVLSFPQWLFGRIGGWTKLRGADRNSWGKY